MKQIKDETASRLIGLMSEFRRCLDKGGVVLDPDIVDERITEIDARIAEIENADPVPECVYLSREEVTLIVDEVIPAAIDGHGQYGYSDCDEVRACKQLEESLRARASDRRGK